MNNIAYTCDRCGRPLTRRQILHYTDEFGPDRKINRLDVTNKQIGELIGRFSASGIATANTVEDANQARPEIAYLREEYFCEQCNKVSG